MKLSGPPAQVPTLTGLGLIILSALLVGITFLVIGRQKKASC